MGRIKRTIKSSHFKKSFWASRLIAVDARVNHQVSNTHISLAVGVGHGRVVLDEKLRLVGRLLFVPDGHLEDHVTPGSAFQHVVHSVGGKLNH